MTVQTLCNSFGWTILTEGDLSRAVTGCYCGDLLSWVMGKAQEGDCWLTVMGNVNAVAVAVLTDCACIVLTEHAALDEEAKARAEQQGVTILTTEQNAYQAAAALSKVL
ncbi:MAG: hypothetical protein II621_01085 [Clostridia bacterium]|jgi:hypothetical protein|nr:hypothetical protein [Clostridia bacterium]MBQ4365668.1 hypothetical protein [Clostridia bacterium]MBQ6092629.1 hypothetical protein [Clostridia bacterium]MBR3095270.1 hypothetical protein [Clostridia bacterium]